MMQNAERNFLILISPLYNRPTRSIAVSVGHLQSSRYAGVSFFMIAGKVAP